MTREEFAAQCERAAVLTARLSATSSTLRWLGEQLKRGEPPWWRLIAKSWEKRRFQVWTEAWTLLLACVHFEALNDAHSPLVPYFPSCGGTAEADPAVGLSRLFQAPPETLAENLRKRQVRAYSPDVPSFWMSAALYFFQRKRRMPYYIIGVDAGAGLDLAVDIVASMKGFRSDLIEARVGLEPDPLIVEDVLHRRWLTACQFPDDLQAIGELDLAMEKVAAANKEDASFIQLAPCTAEKAPAFIAKNIPVEDDAGLLVFNAGTTGRMSDPEYAAYAKGMTQMLSRWGERGLWVEVERVRGEMFSTTIQVRLHRVSGSQLRSGLLATVDTAAGTSQYFDSSEEFLSVASGK